MYEYIHLNSSFARCICIVKDLHLKPSEKSKP